MISFRQYKLTDMFLFAVILAAFELIVHYAYIAYDGDFVFSPMLALTLIVMMRWGWPAVFYAVLDGALYVLLNGGNLQLYAIYCIGNAFVMLLLLATKFIGKEKISSRWYFTTLFVIVGWVALILGRAVVAACFGNAFLSSLGAHAKAELMSLAVAIVIILVMRRLDGMWEDQKHYLNRLDKERREKMRLDTFGDEPIEIDEESLSILRKKDDDMY